MLIIILQKIKQNYLFGAIYRLVETFKSCLEGIMCNNGSGRDYIDYLSFVGAGDAISYACTSDVRAGNYSIIYVK